MPYHDYAMHGGDGPHTLAWVLMILLFVLLVGLIVLLVTKWDGGRRAAVAGPAPLGPRTGDDPQELVRLRYARGEIDRETFLQVSQDLAPPPG
jgi:uncharacterized membrane protein